jgi:tyrosyl-tRNA synthetase
MANLPTVTELLTRGVDTIYPSRAALEKRLKQKEPIKLYLGCDPTGPDLHVGHLVVLQKLRQFQQAGHKVVLLLGDFTGRIGDPTDKQATRQPLTQSEVVANAQRFQRQVARVLDFDGPNPATIAFNSKWLSKLRFEDVVELAGHFTVQQLLERDMFENRLKQGKPISLREFLYPLMQGYDSVELAVDLEVGATDQTFNMLAGRKLAKEYLGKEKFVLATPILTDAGGRKIGKTEGNAIAIDAPAEDLYGQLMALPDEVIVPASEWCTSQSRAHIQELAALVKKNPRDAKMQMARAIVAEVNDEATALSAQEAFVKRFQRHELPDDIPAWKAPAKAQDRRLWNVLRTSGLASSSSEARRLISQRAVRFDGVVTEDPDTLVERGMVVQVGKKRALKIT